MASDPKANPDVPRERPDFMDWLEAWLNGYNAALRGVPNDEGIVAVAREGFENGGTERAKQLVAALESRFPVSAEPRCEDDEHFTIYYCPKCGRYKCDPGDMVIHSRDCGGTYGPIEVVRVSAEPSPDNNGRCRVCGEWRGPNGCCKSQSEPSPNPLREALERFRKVVVRELYLFDGDWDSGQLADHVDGVLNAAIHEALATDQSRSDRTSDEVTPAEPTRCGWCLGEGALREADGKLGEDCPRCHGASVLRVPDEEGRRDG